MSNNDESPRMSLTERTYLGLRDEILTCRRAPGALLLEQELAAQYGLSKTPIREALRLLVQEGWVLVLPRRGYLVRPLGLTDVREVFDMRSWLEPHIIEQVAQRASEVDIASLTVHIDAQESAANDRSRAALAGSEFHLGLARLAGNQRAERTLRGLLDEVQRLHHMVPTLQVRLNEEQEFDDHRTIVKLLTAGESDAAAQVMRKHLAESLRQMVHALTQL